MPRLNRNRAIVKAPGRTLTFRVQQCLEVVFSVSVCRFVFGGFLWLVLFCPGSVCSRQYLIQSKTDKPFPCAINQLDFLFL